MTISGTIEQAIEDGYLWPDVLADDVMFRSMVSNNIMFGFSSNFPSTFAIKPTGVFVNANQKYVNSAALFLSCSGPSNAQMTTGSSIGNINFTGRYGNSFDASCNTMASVGAVYTGTGTTKGGDLIFSTDCNAGLVERARIVATGNFGIGTSSPQFVLDVNGPARFAGSVYAGNGVICPGSNASVAANLLLNVNGGTCSVNGPLTAQGLNTMIAGLSNSNASVTFGKNTSNNNAGWVGFVHGGQDGSQSNYTALGVTGQSALALPPLVVSGYGNVGVGTSVPSARLTVADVDGTSDLNTYGLVQITQNSAGVSGRSNMSALAFVRSSNKIVGVGFAKGSNTFGVGWSTCNANFAPSLLSFDNAGSVGVGTLVPGYKLDVAGQANAQVLSESGALLVNRYALSNAPYLQLAGGVLTGALAGTSVSSTTYSGSNASFSNLNTQTALCSNATVSALAFTSAAGPALSASNIATSNLTVSGNLYATSGVIYPSTATTNSANLLLNVYGGTCSINGPVSHCNFAITGVSTLSASVVQEGGQTLVSKYALSNTPLLPLAGGTLTGTLNVSIPTAQNSGTMLKTTMSNGNIALYFADVPGRNSAIAQQGDVGLAFATNSGYDTGNFVLGPWTSNATKGIRVVGSSGNVGIGKSNPAFILDVNGQANAAIISENSVALSTKYAMSNAPLLPLTGGTLSGLLTGTSITTTSLTGSNAALSNLTAISTSTSNAAFSNATAITYKGSNASFSNMTSITQIGSNASFSNMTIGPGLLTANVITATSLQEGGANIVGKYALSNVLNNYMTGVLVSSTFNSTTHNASNANFSNVVALKETVTNATITNATVSSLATVTQLGSNATFSNLTAATASFCNLSVTTVNFVNATETSINSSNLSTSNLVVSGNAGFGTSTPAFRLTVGTGGSDTSSALQINTSDCDKIYLTSVGTNASKISHSGGWTVNHYAGQNNSAGGAFTFNTGTPSGYNQCMVIGPNVGINNSSPAYTLDVNGTTQTSTLITPTVQCVAGYLNIKSEYQINYQADYDGNNSGADHVFYSSSNEKMRITAGGSVGINTSSPGYTLDVDGSCRIASGMALGNSASGNFFIDNVSTSSAPQTIIGYNTAKSTSSTGVLQVYNNSTDRNIVLCVSSAGTGGGVNGVGIGTGNPAYTLDVAGNARVNSMVVGDMGFGADYAGLAHQSMATTVNYGFLQQNTGQTIINTAAGQAISFRNSNGDVAILTNGSFGVGTTSPQYKIEANGSINGTTLYENGTSLSSKYHQISSLNAYSNWVDSQYAKSSYLGSYHTNTAFNAYSNWVSGNYLTASSLSPYATTSSLASYWSTTSHNSYSNWVDGVYAKSSSLSSYHTTSAFNTYSNWVSSTYATTSSLGSYATTSSLGNYTTTTSFSSFSNWASPQIGNNVFGQLACGLIYCVADSASVAKYNNMYVPNYGIRYQTGDNSMNLCGYYNVNIATIGNTGKINFYTNAGTTGETVPKMTISATGLVGIGKADASYALDVSSTQNSIFAARFYTNQNQGLILIGNSNVDTKNWRIGADLNSSFIVYNNANVGVYCGYGGQGWSAQSDARLKKNIVPVSDDALDRLCELNPVRHNWTYQEDDERRVYGLIAQEVEKSFPELVGECPSVDFADGVKSVHYTELTPVLIKAVQQLRAELVDKTACIETLQRENEEIKKFLASKFPYDHPFGSGK
jgi:Chaperone of endosialidase